MPKRKREDADGEPSEAHAKIGQQRQARVEQKLHHGQKLLQRALKIAKGFERQKLSRRQKHAEQSDKSADGASSELARIEAEIEATKNLDIASAAEAHLYKSILKIKRLASSPSLPPNVVEFKRPLLDAATANVTARLFNSNPVKDCMNKIIDSVFSAMEIPKERVEPTVTKGVKQRRAREQAEGSDVETPLPFRTAAAKDNSGDEEKEDDDDEDQETQALEDERIASASASSMSRSESPKEEREQPTLRSKSAFISSLSSSRARDVSVSISASSSEEEEEEEEEEENEDSMLASRYGYMSDSQSSASDLDQDERLHARKNRRGQRARQQIWEKKFGAGAKHLREQQQQSQGQSRGKKRTAARDEGWDPKRGAQSSSGAGAGAARSRAARGEKRAGAASVRKIMRHGKLVTVASPNVRGSKSASDANAIAVDPLRRTSTGRRQQQQQQQQQQQEEKPLHPSWEAAKRAKQIKATSMQRGLAGPQGKKVVFD